MYLMLKKMLGVANIVTYPTGYINKKYIHLTEFKISTLTRISGGHKTSYELSRFMYHVELCPRVQFFIEWVYYIINTRIKIEGYQIANDNFVYNYIMINPI